MPEKIKVTKSTILGGQLHHKDSVLEIGKQIPRKHADALLELEHAEEHEEPAPQQQQQQRPPEPPKEPPKGPLPLS
jgi:hypothetical protein